jgi:hypothetical protein
VVRLIAPIESGLARMKSSHEVDPSGTSPVSFRPAIEEAVGTLAQRWDENFSAQAPGAGIETNIDGIRISMLELITWDKCDPKLWSSAEDVLKACRAIERRAREILGTSRPSRVRLRRVRGHIPGHSHYFLEPPEPSRVSPRSRCTSTDVRLGSVRERPGRSQLPCQGGGRGFECSRPLQVRRQIQVR